MLGKQSVPLGFVFFERWPFLGRVLLLLFNSFGTLFFLTSAVIFAFFQQWQLYRVFFFPFGSRFELWLFFLCVYCVFVSRLLHQ